MTSNQIAYVKAREEQRHNYQMEAETQRSDLARERENSRANDLNYAASIYGSQASMYNAQLAHSANVYAAQMNAATQKYVQDQRTMMAQHELTNLMFNQDVINAETHRHNKIMEDIEGVKAGSNRVSTMSNVLNAVGGIAKVAHLFAVT